MDKNIKWAIKNSYCSSPTSGAWTQAPVTIPAPSRRKKTLTNNDCSHVRIKANYWRNCCVTEVATALTNNNGILHWHNGLRIVLGGCFAPTNCLRTKKNLNKAQTTSSTIQYFQCPAKWWDQFISLSTSQNIIIFYHMIHMLSSFHHSFPMFPLEISPTPTPPPCYLNHVPQAPGMPVPRHSLALSVAAFMADIREESSEAWASKSRDSSWEFRYNGLGNMENQWAPEGIYWKYI